MTALETPVEPPATSTRLPLIALLFVVLSWGAGPVVTKLITAPPLVGVLIRFGLSIPVLFGILLLRGRWVSRKVLFQGALPGIAFGINLIFVFATLQEATVSVLAVSVALQPALLLIAAGPLFGERPTLVHVLWTLFGVLGAGVVILGAGDELRTSALGLILALSAMLTFSVYFVLTRVARSTGDVDPMEWMASINLWSFLAAVPPGLLLLDIEDVRMVDRTDLFWLAVLAYLTGVFGHVLMSWVHGYVEAARSSLYILLMHVIAVGLAWPVHGESINIVQAAGGLIVLISVAAVIRLPARVVA